MYFLARGEDGIAQGYGLVEIFMGPDDTFAVGGGIVEVVSLVVDESARGQGVGGELMRAVEDLARQLGAEVLRVAVMAGNASAEAFYAADGFAVGEHVLYRPVREAPG